MSKELIKKIEAKITAEMSKRSSLIATIEKENRDFTADEQKSLDDSVAAVANYRAQIKQLETASTQIVEIREDANGRNEPEERSVPRVSRRSFNNKELTEMAGFSFFRAIRIAGGLERADGIEAEMMQEGSKEIRDSDVMTAQGNLQLPSFLMFRKLGTHNQPQQRAGTVTVSPVGGEVDASKVVQTDVMDIQNPFFNAAILPSMGATVVSGLRGNLQIPRFSFTNEPTVKTEIGAADKIVPSFNGVTLKPFRVPSYIDITTQTLLQNAVSLEQSIQQALFEQLMGKWTRLALNGAGTTESLGILNDTDIATVVGGTDGAQLDLDILLDLEENVAALDVPLDGAQAAYITNTKVRGKAKRTLAFSGVSQGTLWEQGNMMNGYNVGITNAMPRTLTKGASSGICSGMAFGLWRYLWMAQWAGVDFIVDRLTQASTGTMRLHAGIFVDAGAVRKDVFAKCKDILTSPATT